METKAKQAKAECPPAVVTAPPVQPASVLEANMAYANSEGVTINHVPAGGLVAGVMVVIGAVVGISTVITEDGDTAALAVEGVFAIPSNNAVFAQGDLVDVDATNQWAVATTLGDRHLGTVWQDSAAEDDHVLVKINTPLS